MRCLDLFDINSENLQRGEGLARLRQLTFETWLNIEMKQGRAQPCFLNQ
jgi:hypothetical protein